MLLNFIGVVCTLIPLAINLCTLGLIVLLLLLWCLSWFLRINKVLLGLFEVLMCTPIIEVRVTLILILLIVVAIIVPLSCRVIVLILILLIMIVLLV
jgi:hypothetical protein